MIAFWALLLIKKNLIVHIFHNGISILILKRITSGILKIRCYNNYAALCVRMDCLRVDFKMTSNLITNLVYYFMYI